MVCARSQPPSTQSVRGHADADRLLVRKRLAHRVEHFERKAHAVRQRAAILIGALVGNRRQELVQEIAVRGMHLDGIDAEPLGALGGGDERLAHALEPRRIERQWRRLALLVRNGRRALHPPAAFGDRNQLAAVPRRVARRLAAGMGELHHDGGLRALAHRGQDRLQRRFGGVVVEAETARRDTAARLHGGRLDAEDRRPRQRQRIDVGEVPVIGLAVDRTNTGTSAPP